MGQVGLVLGAVDMSGLLSSDVVEVGTRIGLGLVIFVIGYLGAKFMASVAYRALKKATVDDRVATAIGVSPERAHGMDKVAASVVFWLIIAMVFVAVLDFVGMSQAAAPIEMLLGTLMLALPPIGKAVLILGVAWVAARLLRSGIQKMFAGTSLDEMVAGWNTREESEGPEAPSSFTEGLGRFVYWLVLFFGITATMDALGISAIVDPIKDLLATALNMIPSLVVAALILLVGYYAGKLCRSVVSNLLQSAGLDRLVERIKLQRIFDKHSASDVAGLIVMAFVVIQAVIAALGKLGIDTLAAPLTEMMAQFWGILPAALISAVIIAVGVVVARISEEIVAGVLEGVGFDGLLERLGLAHLAEKSEHLQRPSRLAGKVAAITVILVATIQALENLGLGAWASYLETLLGYAVRNVLPAIVIVGIALALAAFVRDLIASTAGEGDAERRWLAEVARYAILVFAFTMALHQLDVAQGFVTTAFSILFGAVCLAGALAFGLGGRDVAGDIVKKRYEANRSKEPE